MKLWIDADCTLFYPRYFCCVTRYNWHDVKQTPITAYGPEIAVYRTLAWIARAYRTILRNRSTTNRIWISVKIAPITLKAKVSSLNSNRPLVSLILVPLLFPLFRANLSDSPELCCDADNVKTLTENLNMAESIFGRCPTCLRNAYKLLCDLTCSPEQSKFLHVTKKDNYTTESGKRKEYVKEIEVSDIPIFHFACVSLRILLHIIFDPFLFSFFSRFTSKRNTWTKLTILVKTWSCLRVGN